MKRKEGATRWHNGIVSSTRRQCLPLERLFEKWSKLFVRRGGQGRGD